MARVLDGEIWIHLRTPQWRLRLCAPSPSCFPSQRLTHKNSWVCTAVTRSLLSKQFAMQQLGTCLDSLPHLNIKMRAIQTDWLVDVATNYKLRFLVSVLYGASAQQYLDRRPVPWGSCSWWVLPPCCSPRSLKRSVLQKCRISCTSLPLRTPKRAQ